MWHVRRGGANWMHPLSWESTNTKDPKTRIKPRLKPSVKPGLEPFEITFDTLLWGGGGVGGRHKRKRSQKSFEKNCFKNCTSRKFKTTANVS